MQKNIVDQQFEIGYAWLAAKQSLHEWLLKGFKV